MITVHLLMYQVAKCVVVVCDHCAAAVEGGIRGIRVVKAVEAAGRVIERRAMVQLVAKVVMNGMLTDEARCVAARATHLVRHQHFCAGGVKRIIRHHTSVCRMGIGVKLVVVQVGCAQVQSIGD